MFDGFEEFFGTGVGDGSEVLNEFLASHTDAGVVDGDGAGGFICGDLDIEFELVVADIGITEGDVAEFFEGIGGIGNELANEDIFVCVEGVDNDVEYLFNFCLKAVFFGV